MQDDAECGCTIVATGPLTSDALSKEIERLTGSGHLAFYDSISPIVDAESIDMSGCTLRRAGTRARPTTSTAR